MWTQLKSQMMKEKNNKGLYTEVDDDFEDHSSMERIYEKYKMKRTLWQ